MDFTKLLLWFVRGSWKTTLTGLVEGVSISLLPILYTGRMPEDYEWLIVFIGVLRFIAGVAAKDGDKSGTGQFGDPVRGTAGPPSIAQVLGEPEPEPANTMGRQDAGQ